MSAEEPKCGFICPKARGRRHDSRPSRRFRRRVRGNSGIVRCRTNRRADNGNRCGKFSCRFNRVLKIASNSLGLLPPDHPVRKLRA